MKTLSKYLWPFVILTIGHLAAASVKPTRIQISDVLAAEKNGCVSYLQETLEKGLNSIGSKKGVVSLGSYHELESQMQKVGLSAFKAKKAVDAIQYVRSKAYDQPTLKLASQMVDDLIEARKLLVCVASKECSLSQAKQDIILFTEQHETIVLMPFPADSPERFAINFFASSSGSAAERLLIAWLQAGYRVKQISDRGHVDLLYDRYARTFNGEYPPTPKSLSQGFTLVFMTLFQASVSQELMSLLFPQDAIKNKKYLAQAIYGDLLFNHNRLLTASIVQQLGITEQNLFLKAQEMFDIMIDTINKGATH